MNELLREISLQSEMYYDRFHNFPTRLYLGYEEYEDMLTALQPLLTKDFSSSSCFAHDNYQGMQIYRVREINHLHVC